MRITVLSILLCTLLVCTGAARADATTNTTTPRQPKLTLLQQLGQLTTQACACKTRPCLIPLTQKWLTAEELLRERRLQAYKRQQMRTLTRQFAGCVARVSTQR